MSSRKKHGLNRLMHIDTTLGPWGTYFPTHPSPWQCTVTIKCCCRRIHESIEITALNRTQIVYLFPDAGNDRGLLGPGRNTIPIVQQQRHRKRETRLNLLNSDVIIDDELPRILIWLGR